MMTRKNNRIFVSCFLITGIIIQVVAYLFTPSEPLSLISGLFGICSVVLCSQGNILTFVFGFGQIITYTCLCWQEKFYAGIAMNIFYFCSQIYGIYAWRKLLKSDTDESSRQIIPRGLKRSVAVTMLILVIVCSSWTGWLLSYYTDDTQPYFDAFTTVPAIVAQILMVAAYKEQWYIWFAIDILYVIMWLQADNACMTMQYVFWCANCIYGYFNWKKIEQQSVSTIN